MYIYCIYIIFIYWKDKMVGDRPQLDQQHDKPSTNKCKDEKHRNKENK